jgi:hypothetical protein
MPCHEAGVRICMQTCMHAHVSHIVCALPTALPCNVRLQKCQKCAWDSVGLHYHERLCGQVLSSLHSALVGPRLKFLNQTSCLIHAGKVACSFTAASGPHIHRGPAQGMQPLSGVLPRKNSAPAVMCRPMKGEQSLHPRRVLDCTCSKTSSQPERFTLPSYVHIVYVILWPICITAIAGCLQCTFPDRCAQKIQGVACMHSVLRASTSGSCTCW